MRRTIFRPSSLRRRRVHPVRLGVLTLVLVTSAGLATGVPSRAHADTPPTYTVTDLGTFDGGSYSRATGINASGQVVGDSQTNGKQGEHAFLYDDSASPHMRDLNRLIPFSSGVELTDARGIKDLGQIAAYGTINGQRHAFRLTPVGLVCTSTGCTPASNELEWLVPTPPDRDYLAPSNDTPLHFFVKASAPHGTVTITHSSTGLMTCDEAEHIGNPAVVSCQVAAGQFRLGAVTFAARSDAGLSISRVYYLGQGRYAALGDSYAAGQGTYDYDPGTNTSTDMCHRSSNSAWGGLLEHSRLPQVPQYAFDFVACGGAIIPDIIGGDGTNNGHNQGEGSQIRALTTTVSMQVGLVTLSVGGNDVGFAPVLTNCFNFNPLSKPCRSSDASVSQAIEDLRAKLPTLYRTLKRNAPHARIVVMDYPAAFSSAPPYHSQDSNCYFRTTDDLKWLNEKAQEIDNVIAASAVRSGVARLVDVYDAFDGHGACDDNAWINGVQSGPGKDIAASFHPNKLGQQSLYQRARSVIVASAPSPMFPTEQRVRPADASAPSSTFSATLYPGDTQTYSVTVAPGQDAVTFSSDWPDVDSDVAMSVTTPSGRMIDRSTRAADVDHDNGPGYEVYSLSDPEPGVWSVTVHGLNVPMDGESVDVTAAQTPHTNRPPIASYTEPVTMTTVSTPLTFDASASYDPDGSVVAYKWDFGDGATATGVTATHAYTQPGVYYPLLTVTDNDGAVGYVGNGSVTVTAAVPPPPPTTSTPELDSGELLSLGLFSIGITLLARRKRRHSRR